MIELILAIKESIKIMDFSKIHMHPLQKKLFMKECNCKEKQVLVEGDRYFVAREIWCPKHGYLNSCYLCNKVIANTTETCRNCSEHMQTAWDSIIDD
jgi:hypothetical protein